MIGLWATAGCIDDPSPSVEPEDASIVSDGAALDMSADAQPLPDARAPVDAARPLDATPDAAPDCGGCRSDDDCVGSAPGGREALCVHGECGAACVPAFVCCNLSNPPRCELTPEDGCEGALVPDLLDCADDPCRARCAVNSDCADDRYCTGSGWCARGCRVEDPDSCPADTEVCDPERRDCVEVRCDGPEDCPDGYFCNDAGVCAPGCGRDADCPGNDTCVFGECLHDHPHCDDRCDPECFDVRGVCEGCESHDECLAEERCDFEIRECVIGCRDDEPAHGRVDDALAIDLPVEPDGDGFKVADVNGRRYCGDVPDFFSIDLGRGERLQLSLTYDPWILEVLELRLVCGDGDVQEARGLANPKVLEYPPLNVVGEATTCFVEVFGQVGLEEGVDYALRAVVGVPEARCFPDEAEAGDGDDVPQSATPVGPRISRFQGTVCGDDEDWFSMDLGDAICPYGLAVSMSISGASDEAEFLLYSAGRLDEPGGLGNPNFTSPALPVEGPNGPTYRLEVPHEDDRLAPWGDWFLRVRSRAPNGAAEYRLSIEPLPTACCGDDSDTEPNDDLGQAVDLRDDRFGVSADGELPAGEDLRVDLLLEICARDRDVFCFEVEADDDVQAWTVGAGVAGDFTVQLLDAEGEPVGQPGSNNRRDSASRARWDGAAAGRVCVQVDGDGGAQGPYRLFVRRDPGDLACAGPPP